MTRYRYSDGLIHDVAAQMGGHNHMRDCRVPPGQCSICRNWISRARRALLYLAREGLIEAGHVDGPLRAAERRAVADWLRSPKAAVIARAAAAECGPERDTAELAADLTRLRLAEHVAALELPHRAPTSRGKHGLEDPLG